ncbi:L-alanine exporter AlaE [Puniceibacterium sp. IMCC21224]|uniref:L-alanine exporter AlaE n=1 Tax=Puniceibacterium sp. IMCC21224 TaxID=1618204 RepID=UPI00064DFDA1|nr:L-alanine exporter AlaE [Puniceibacterium sp. IMCC21224]KMK66067.1 Protein of unknown function (DUF1144) [Puniceibacterium sp. IMCC21224]
MRQFIVDTIATIVFFSCVAAFSEAVIAGMAPEQVLAARLIMVPVMVLTGRPYGIWRDWLIARTEARSTVSRIVVDISAFLLFQVPVYVMTLAVAGASPEAMLAAVSSAIVFMVLLSRPFGLFLEMVRRKSGVPVI